LIKVTAFGYAGFDLRQRAHFFGHRPQHQGRRFTFLTQAFQRSRQARQIAGQQELQCSHSI
jgi:hypothetical protein